MQLKTLIIALLGMYLAASPALSEDKITLPSTKSPSQNLALLSNKHQDAEKHISLKNYKKAIKTYEEILSMNPHDEVAYTNMGHSYILMGEYDRAKICFKNALDINRENQSAMLGIIRISERIKTRKA